MPPPARVGSTRYAAATTSLRAAHGWQRPPYSTDPRASIRGQHSLPGADRTLDLPVALSASWGPAVALCLWGAWLMPHPPLRLPTCPLSRAVLMERGHLRG